MSLSIGQLEYNGVIIGPGGTAQLTSVDGLTGLPTSRNQDVNRPNAQGMLGGWDFMGNRSITIAAEVTATGGNYMPVNLETLRAALLMSTGSTGGVNPDASQTLTFNLGTSGDRRVAGRVRKLDAPVDVAFIGSAGQSGIVKVSIMLDCIDPLIYDATTQSSTIGLTIATGGLTFPVTPPFTFGSQSGGNIYAVNNGSIAGPAYMTIAGPCLNPRVEQKTSGVTLQWNTQLNAGDSLVVDTFFGSAILNGTAPRLDVLAPGSYITAFDIQPGTNDIGFYSDDVTDPGGTLTLEWANTWA